QPPVQIDLERPLRLVVVDHVVVAAEIEAGAAVAELKNAATVGRIGRLLQQKQQLRNARLTGAVGAEEHGERRQPDLARVAPGLEVGEPEPCEHACLDVAGPQYIVAPGDGRVARRGGRLYCRSNCT